MFVDRGINILVASRKGSRSRPFICHRVMADKNGQVLSLCMPPLTSRSSCHLCYPGGSAIGCSLLPSSESLFRPVQTFSSSITCFFSCRRSGGLPGLQPADQASCLVSPHRGGRVGACVGFCEFVLQRSDEEKRGILVGEALILLFIGHAEGQWEEHGERDHHSRCVWRWNLTHLCIFLFETTSGQNARGTC
jgi:hypothetical protein